MANGKDKCCVCFFLFSLLLLCHLIFSCSKGDDDSHENLIDWGNLFEFPQLVFASWLLCYRSFQESVARRIGAVYILFYLTRFEFGSVRYISEAVRTHLRHRSQTDLTLCFGKTTTVWNIRSDQVNWRVSETNVPTRHSNKDSRTWLFCNNNNSNTKRMATANHRNIVYAVMS